METLYFSSTCVSTALKCLSCVEDYYFTFGYDKVNANTCRNTSPGANFYLDTNIYKQCSSNCASCTGGADDKCTSCGANYYKQIYAVFTNPGTKCYASNSSPDGYYWKNGLNDHNPC